MSQLGRGAHMQDGQGPQEALCRFVGRGGRAERDAFYRRLAGAQPRELPRAQGVADVILEADGGAATPAFA